MGKKRDRRIRVVFEFTGGSQKGQRVWCAYAPEAIEQIRKKTAKPESSRKIVAEVKTDAEAIRSCAKIPKDFSDLFSITDR